MEVKLPKEGLGSGPEDEVLIFWITVKIGDKVYQAVLDTGDTLPIVAGRLLKQSKIWKAKTVAI